jgi:glycosyltransferase involved in cell wall biosynthesis
MAERTRVLWVLKGLGPGGAERLVVQHAAAGDRTAFEYEVAYLLPWKQHLVPELEALGVATHCLDVRTAADPRWVPRLRRLVRDGHFDVVHLHSPALAALARPVLHVGGDRPALVYTEHNRWPSYHPLTRAANRATMRLDDATVAVSEDVRASMGKHREHVEVIVHGIDTQGVRRHLAERGAVRAELGVGEDELLAVTVANLRAAKGYPDLLAAARLVADRHAPIRFVAAGQGPLEAELRARVEELGLGDRFRLLGYAPDAARLVAGADLFVLASRHEGLPLAVMEALALGVPVVATRVGGLPELVEDGVSGVLVEPGDAAALAAAILTLTDDATRARLAAGATARGAHVDGRVAVARLDQIYADLAADRAADRAARRAGAP